MARRRMVRDRRTVIGAGTAAMAAALLLSTLASAAGAAANPSLAQAKKYLLVLSDMPKGWTPEKNTGGSGSGSSGLPGGSQLAACIGVPASVVNDNSPSTSSPYYQNKDQSLEVQDSITVYRSSSYAHTQFAAMNNAKTPSCVAAYMNGPGKSAITAQGEKGETVGTATVTALDPHVYGAGVTGIVMNIPITFQGVTVATQIISVNAIKGKIGQSITYNSYGPTFPHSLAKHLTSVALSRL